MCGCIAGVKKKMMDLKEKVESKSVEPLKLAVTLYYQQVRMYYCFCWYFFVSRVIGSLLFIIGLATAEARGGVILVCGVTLIYFITHFCITLKSYRMFKYFLKKGGVKKFVKRFFRFRKWDKAFLICSWLNILFCIICLIVMGNAMGTFAGLALFLYFIEGCILLILLILYLIYYYCYVPLPARKVMTMIDSLKELAQHADCSGSSSEDEESHKPGVQGNTSAQI